MLKYFIHGVTSRWPGHCIADTEDPLKYVYYSDFQTIPSHHKFAHTGDLERHIQSGSWREVSYEDLFPDPDLTMDEGL